MGKAKEGTTTKKKTTTEKKTKKTTEGVTKKKKDKDAPKGVRGPYILFSQDKRQEILEENPKLKVTEVSKELGKRWKAMSDTDKQPYVKKSEEDKKRYKDELAKYEKKKKAAAAESDDDEEEE